MFVSAVALGLVCVASFVIIPRLWWPARGRQQIVPSRFSWRIANRGAGAASKPRAAIQRTQPAGA
jgi:hypothetical protein